MLTFYLGEEDTMKIVRIAIFLTGIMGLAMGGITTISSLKTSQDEATLRSNEYLKSQGALLVDQFFGVLEAVKNENQGANSTTLSYVTNRAILKLNQGVPTEFESFTNANQAANTEANDLGLQDRVLNALKQQIAIADLQLSHIGLGTYNLTEVGNKEGVFIATPIFKVTNGVADPATIEKLNVILIDPVKTFGGIQKFSSVQDSAAYLISKNGRVLAHSLSSYVGTDVRKVGKLKTTIENLFLGAQTGSVNTYNAVDGVKQQVAFVRAGVYPFAFAVEQKARPAILSSAWMTEQMDSGAARKNAGIAFIVIAMALMSFSGISFWTSKQIGKQIAENAASRMEPSEGLHIPANRTWNTPVSVTAPAEAFALASANGSLNHSAVNRAAEEFVQARAQLNFEQKEASAIQETIASKQDVFGAFSKKIAIEYTLEGIEKELAETSADLTGSSVLYFRYQRKTQNLILSTLAGHVRVPNYSVMQAYVRKDIEMQIENLANDGKVASISNYGPMMKLIVSHLNIARFEAWAVTSSHEVSGQPKMVGVLVILQTGEKSNQVRPMLARILKESGNYLYAQGNKLRPRSSPSANQNQNTLTQDNSLV